MSTKSIQAATQAQNKPAEVKKPSINIMLNSIIDGEGMRKRFNELLGERTPQFISSLVTLINAEPKLQQALIEAPLTVIQAALTAAIYDLPIEPSLGYAYIVPFRNSRQDEKGRTFKRMEANFIIGYKGLTQLCLRTGAYARVPDAVDVREGELIHYDRLTGDIELRWIEDEEERDKLPIIGYAGYFRLTNGAEKYIYMTKKQIADHEKKHRKGDYMGKGWRDDWDAMARKTVIRRLCGKYGLMSIQYQTQQNKDTVNLAQALMDNEMPASAILDTLPEAIDTEEVIEANAVEVSDSDIDIEQYGIDPETGEVVS